MQLGFRFPIFFAQFIFPDLRLFIIKFPYFSFLFTVPKLLIWPLSADLIICLTFLHTLDFPDKLVPTLLTSSEVFSTIARISFISLVITTIASLLESKDSFFPLMISSITEDLLLFDPSNLYDSLDFLILMVSILVRIHLHSKNFCSLNMPR